VVNDVKPDVPLDVAALRREFPLLASDSRGKPLVYLDNAATTQKPRAVIDAICRYYERDNANIHRGVYELSQRATDQFERVRVGVQRLLNAPDPAEVIFVRGATEAMNLVASSWGRANLKHGDVVLLSGFEHHSGIVPWQLACEATGATVVPIPITDRGELQVDEYARLLSTRRVRMVNLVHVSNSLGTVNDVRTLTSIAHEHGALVLIDGAQWIAHGPTDVRDIGCDFYVFSGHKLYGPTGIGVLWGRRELLEAMPPFMGGGDMIERVSFEKTTYAPLPSKFEAGTPDIAGVVGLGAAIEFVQSLGLARIAESEAKLYRYAVEQIGSVPGVRIVGQAPRRAGAISFVVEKPPMAAHDVATLLDLDGIAVRSGHHCTQPLMDRLGIPATVRASLAIYNTTEEIDALVASLRKIVAGAATTRPVSSDDVLRFPEPSAASVRAAADELIETFDFLGDNEQRQHFLLDLGKQIPPMPASLKNDQTRVHGCASVVHLFARQRDGRLDFLADSDAFIVRGLIGLLQKLFAGQRVEEIVSFDVEALFRSLKLDQHITTQRRNGLAAMVERIRRHANAPGAEATR
jgi:cysteine desulfurase/selenocysteine lyase